MKRSIVLCLLLAIGAMSMAVAAQQAPRVIEVEKIKDNLYVLKGGGGNSAVFITSTGVVVVDAKNPGWGQPLLDKTKELTNKPITTLINSHTHGDHVSGNVEFPPTVEIIAHENTKTRMGKMLPSSAAQNQTPPAQTIFQANNGRGMPTRTFKDKLTLSSGADQVEVYFFGTGNTDGDAWVLFPALRVAVAGDVFGAKNIPLLDANNGGSAIAMVDTIQKAYDTFKNVDMIITGHGPQMTAADLREYVELNREFLEDMRAAKRAGKTVDEVAAAWKIPAKYVGYGPADPNRLKNNIRLAYAELERADG
jgi:glyoxylase-like metal-dependent hydrolase (beta-lactamase superfamily II)